METILKSDKGQLGSLQAVIGTLIVVGVLIAAGFLVVQEFLEQDEFSDTQTTVTAEIGYINETGYTLDGASSTAFNSVSITNLTNYTDGTSIGLGNVTVSDSGVVTNATATTWANVSIDYTYQYGESSYTGVNDTLLAMDTVPELLGLIVLVIVIAIVLAIVFNTVPGSRATA